MTSLKETIFDITPAPVYRAYRWTIERPKHIKWWFERANGKLPDCDSWSYKDTLADNVKQGLEYLLRENGCINWEADSQHKKMKKELEKALDWFRHYEAYEAERILIVRDENETQTPKFDESVACYMTKEAFKEYEQQRKEAFKILGKYFYALWD